MEDLERYGMVELSADGSLEEIAFEMGFISADEAPAAGERFSRTAYGRAILKTLERS